MERIDGHLRQRAHWAEARLAKVGTVVAWYAVDAAEVLTELHLRLQAATT